jgi:hypothetical protein
MKISEFYGMAGAGPARATTTCRAQEAAYPLCYQHRRLSAPGSAAGAGRARRLCFAGLPLGR